MYAQYFYSNYCLLRLLLLILMFSLLILALDHVPLSKDDAYSMDHKILNW